MLKRIILMLLCLLFLLPLCAVFPQHSGRGTGSVVGEILFRREQE